VDSAGAEELKRVSAKYAPMRAREVGLWLAVIAVMAIVARYRDVSWVSFVGIVSGLVIWEITKFCLRRNAHSYARAVGAR
jgi:hypothetical protein